LSNFLRFVHPKGWTKCNWLVIGNTNTLPFAFHDSRTICDNHASLLILIVKIQNSTASHKHSWETWVYADGYSQLLLSHVPKLNNSRNFSIQNRGSQPILVVISSTLSHLL